MTDAQWVATRLSTLTPTWDPDVTRALARARQREAPRWRVGWVGWVATATMLLVALAFAPPGRTLAQALWYRLFVTRVEVVRLDFSHVPLDTSIRTDGASVQVASLEEATARAGFAPRVVSSAVLPHPPTLSVTSAIAVTQTIRTGPLRDALDRVGATDLEVPDTWDGVVARATVGPLVVADYADEVSVVQAAPIRLDLPAGFPLARLAEIVFRAAGSTWWEARALGEAYAASTAWLLDIPGDEQALVETVPMADGLPAIVIDEVSDGVTRTTVLLSRATGIAAVSSANRALSLQIAEDLRALGRPGAPGRAP